MVKLATARENRMYGPRGSRNMWEYMAAGVYVLATVLVFAGVLAQLSGMAKAGLIVLMIGLLLFAIVTAHDLYAHLAGVDYNVMFAEHDLQLGLVELAAPLVETIGSILTFVGVLLLYLQAQHPYRHSLGKHAINLLIAGPVFWLLGTIHDLCQVYERADWNVQVMQKCVQIPFILGSLLFLLGGIFNRHGWRGPVSRYSILDRSWVWVCIFGALLFFIGAIFNVAKVFKMQQHDARLERLRGNGYERNRDREGRSPLLGDDRRKPHGPHGRDPATLPGEGTAPAGPTPYKNVLVSGDP